MRNLLWVALALGIMPHAFAQPDVTTAYNLNNQGKYEDAVTYIEKAASDPKATSKEKYWRYRGNIYLNIAQDAALSPKFPNAVETAVESFKKAKELDKYGDYSAEVQIAMGNIQKLVNERGDEAYKAGDYCTAARNFETALNISDTYGIVDSAFVFNTAFCYDKCGNSSKAIAGYQRCGEIRYNVPEVYVYISEIQQREGNKEAALQTLSAARALYPRDANLLRSEVNIYLSDGSYDRAEALLKSLTESDPGNETVWFVLGVTYQKLGKKSEEEQAYRSAIQVKPDYYDAIFNLGAMYFNQGLDVEKGCLEIPSREKAKYDDCIAQCKTLFAKSVEQLEAGFALKPDDRELISALKDAYYKAEREEDYMRMKKLLSN